MRIGVIGAGIVGLAVTYELARGGYDVRCFEAATPMGARSTGDARIFRLAHDRPGLVDWALQARRGWEEWAESAGMLLLGGEGTVVSGDIDRLAEAMIAAGAPFRVADETPSLPADGPRGPFLIDPDGGVIRAAATGRFLLDLVRDSIVRVGVRSIGTHDHEVVILADKGRWICDSLVVAAGASTAKLVSPLGIDVPGDVVHHARFTFPLRDTQAVPPCWLDQSGEWRKGFITYGQAPRPGYWAIGGHLPDEESRWDVGRDAVIERSRQVVTQYVTEYVTGAIPDAVETLYCNVTPGLGDGMSAARRGAVLAVWGDNLFKMAPVIGRVLAHAAIDRSLPSELQAVAHIRPTPG